MTFDWVEKPPFTIMTLFCLISEWRWHTKSTFITVVFPDKGVSKILACSLQALCAKEVDNK